MRLFASISKTEELDDGTIKVWGYASSNAVDSDGETITSDAMKAALPDYLKFGAVREMHQAKAAGTAIEANVEADGRTFFGAHIVDAEAVKKVKANVYKGFSIGGKVTERDTLDKSIIKGLKLVEVSLVDRPANPEAVFTMYKADGLAQDDAEVQKAAIDTLAAMLDSGEVTPTDLIALAKAAKAAPENATKKDAEQDDKLAKGMAHVAQLALILKAVTSLIQDQVAEAVREGDGSGIPASLTAWLEQGGEILKAMAAEEAGELVDQAAEGQSNYNAPSSIYLAERALDMLKGDGLANVLEKAGAKFSAATKKVLSDVHTAAKTCVGHLEQLGYSDPTDAAAQKAGSADDLAKVAAELDLAKAEAARLADDLAKAQTEIDALKAMPAPGKALLMAVSKGADVIADDDKTAADKAAAEYEATLKGEALAAYQIKKIFQAGGVR